MHPIKWQSYVFRSNLHNYIIAISKQDAVRLPYSQEGSCSLGEITLKLWLRGLTVTVMRLWVRVRLIHSNWHRLASAAALMLPLEANQCRSKTFHLSAFEPFTQRTMQRILPHESRTQRVVCRCLCLSYSTRHHLFLHDVTSAALSWFNELYVVSTYIMFDKLLQTWH